MSKLIAQLLGKPPEKVSQAIKTAEDSNGNPSADVRVMAAQIPKLRTKINELGLDPDDTTGEELYQALKSKFSADSELVDRAVGVSEDTPLAARIDKAAQMLAGGPLPRRWLIKHPSAKKLLRQLPPKRVMKQLGYRSLDSMLKHQDCDSLLLAAGLIESKTWQSKLDKAVAHLSSADFEPRPLKIISLPEKIAGQLKSAKLFISDKTTGTVAAVSANLDSHAQVLAIALGFIDAAQKLSGEDLSEEVAGLNPSLRWWAQNRCLLSLHEAGPVSLNALDLSIDRLKGREYSQRSTKSAARALLSELASSYEYAPQKVAETLSEIGYNLADELSGLPGGRRLAAEYAEAEL